MKCNLFEAIANKSTYNSIIKILVRSIPVFISITGCSLCFLDLKRRFRPVTLKFVFHAFYWSKRLVDVCDQPCFPVQIFSINDRDSKSSCLFTFAVQLTNHYRVLVLSIHHLTAETSLFFHCICCNNGLLYLIPIY